MTMIVFESIVMFPESSSPSPGPYPESSAGGIEINAQGVYTENLRCQPIS